MTWLKFTVILFLAFTVGGCAALDSLVGINPTTGVLDSNAPVLTVIDLLAILFPAGVAGLGFFATLWVNIRRKKWKQASTDVTRAVTELRRKYKDNKKLTMDEVLEVLSSHQKNGSYDAIKSLRSE